VATLGSRATVPWKPSTDRSWPVSNRLFDAGPLEHPRARSLAQTGTRPEITGANSPRSPGNRGGSGPFVGEVLEPRSCLLALR